jgi:hypothetical protein
MRNMLVLLFSGIFFWGCKKDKDGTVTVVPISPAELTATVISTTQVNLSWTDKSTNETGFKVQRKTGSGAYADIATVNKDITTYSDNGLTPNTTYTYRVYAYNSTGASLSYTNEVTVTTFGSAVLTTTAITNISNTSAKSGGTITSDGGSPITARGIVWSTTSNPTIALTTKTIDGTGTGSFISNLTGLTTNTTYYVRAYATNSAGTSYGNEINFKTLNVDIATGLVAYYPFTGNAGDSSGNNNHGTVNGATLTSDRNGNPNSAYSFNGSGNYISVPYSNSIGVQQNISISVWLYMNGGGCNPRILEINSTYSQCGGYTLITNGTSNIARAINTGFGNCTAGYGTTTTQTLSALQWHHLVNTVDNVNGIGKVYFDGVLVSTYTGTNFIGINYNNNPLTIGNINPSRCDWWGGFLDDIRIYNRVLSDSQVQYLYTH